jgi:hypothetical protein
MEEQDPLIASYRLDKTVIEVVSGFDEVPDDRPF